jgi:predicted deacetylase
MPVNLATIPNVAIGTKMPDGKPEGFLIHKNGEKGPSVPIGSNHKLVNYLRENPGYQIVQHGYNHDYLEFDRPSVAEVCDRLDEGGKLLQAAGFPKPQTFVAPYDKLSRASLSEVARRFRVLSTGWFELRRLPYAWWPNYFVKKLRDRPHWKVGRTLLLTHPGCLLSYTRSYTGMLEAITKHVNQRQLTVLVTHWWEYFRNGEPDEQFIGFLHETADYLATHPDLKVISFSDLVQGRLAVN